MERKINKPGQMSRSEVTNKMKALMGLNEVANTNSTHGFELVKKGSDGNAYAIVRENHEYFLKKALIKENLSYNDFNYIGGLQNKRRLVFESFSKATQNLNLRLIDLKENFGMGFAEEESNLFHSDVNVTDESMFGMGDDIEMMPTEDNFFGEELTAEEKAIDQMINQSFDEPAQEEEAQQFEFHTKMGFESNPYEGDSIESMTDRVMEQYANLDSILSFDESKKKV